MGKLLMPMEGRLARMGHCPPPAPPRCVSAAARACQAMPVLADGGEDAAPEAPMAEEFDLSDVLAEEVSAAPGSKEELLRRADAELQARLPQCRGVYSLGTRLRSSHALLVDPLLPLGGRLLFQDPPTWC